MSLKSSVEAMSDHDLVVYYNDLSQQMLSVEGVLSMSKHRHAALDAARAEMAERGIR